MLSSRKRKDIGSVSPTFIDETSDKKTESDGVDSKKGVPNFSNGYNTTKSESISDASSSREMYPAQTKSPYARGSKKPYAPSEHMLMIHTFHLEVLNQNVEEQVHFLELDSLVNVDAFKKINIDAIKYDRDYLDSPDGVNIPPFLAYLRDCYMHAFKINNLECFSARRIEQEFREFSRTYLYRDIEKVFVTEFEKCNEWDDIISMMDPECPSYLQMESFVRKTFQKWADDLSEFECGDSV